MWPLLEGLSVENDRRESPDEFVMTLAVTPSPFALMADARPARVRSAVLRSLILISVGLVAEPTVMSMVPESVSLAPLTGVRYPLGERPLMEFSSWFWSRERVGVDRKST